MRGVQTQTVNLTSSKGIRKLGLVSAIAMSYGFISNLQGGIILKKLWYFDWCAFWI